MNLFTLCSHSNQSLFMLATGGSRFCCWIWAGWEDINSVVEHWLTSSAEDQMAAEKLQQAKLWGQTLFFLHLALEKKLKAIIVRQSREHAPFSHNLVYLLGKTNLPASEDMIEKLTTISGFNLTGRYPLEKQKAQLLLNKTFVSQWSGIAQEIHQWLDLHLKPH